MSAGSRRRSNSSSAIATSAIASVTKKLGEPPPPAAEAAPEPADPPEVGAGPGGATDDTWLFGAAGDYRERAHGAPGRGRIESCAAS
jgi:hypothetical protein